MFDRNTLRSRGFGFVTFADMEAARQVLSTSHELQGKYVEVKSAEPKENLQQQQQQQQNYNRGGPLHHQGGGGGGYDQRGGPTLGPIGGPQDRQRQQYQAGYQNNYPPMGYPGEPYLQNAYGQRAYDDAYDNAQAYAPNRGAYDPYAQQQQGGYPAPYSPRQNNGQGSNGGGAAANNGPLDQSIDQQYLRYDNQDPYYAQQQQRNQGQQQYYPQHLDQFYPQRGGGRGDSRNAQQQQQQQQQGFRGAY